MRQGEGETNLEFQARTLRMEHASATPLDGALPCEPVLSGVLSGLTATCVHCRMPMDGPRVCPARMSQRGILEEMTNQRAIQRAASEEAQLNRLMDRVAREKHVVTDEMRGGLHAYGAAGQVAGSGVLGGIAQMQRAPEKTFTRSEILVVLRAHRANIGGGAGAENADACIARLITTFERME